MIFCTSNVAREQHHQLFGDALPPTRYFQIGAFAAILLLVLAHHAKSVSGSIRTARSPQNARIRKGKRPQNYQQALPKKHGGKKHGTLPENTK